MVATPTYDPPTRDEWEDMDAENWPKEEFEDYDDMIRWFEVRQSKRVADTVGRAEAQVRASVQVAAFLVLVFLVSKGADAVTGGRF
jgi:hypothetical protein